MNTLTTAIQASGTVMPKPPIFVNTTIAKTRLGQPETKLPSALKFRFYFVDGGALCYVKILGKTDSFRIPFDIGEAKWNSDLKRFTGESAEKQDQKLIDMLTRIGNVYRDLRRSAPVVPTQLISAFMERYKVKAYQKPPSEKETQILAEIEALKREKPINSRKRITLYEQRLDALKEKLVKLKSRDRFQDIGQMSDEQLRKLNHQVRRDRALKIQFKLRKIANSYRHTVQFIVHINGAKSTPQTTGVSVKQTMWDAEAEAIMGNENDTLKIKAIRNGLETLFEEFKKRGKFPTPATLIDHYFNNDIAFDKRISLYDLMLLHLGDLKRKDRSIRTLQAYERTFLQFTSFSQIKCAGDVNLEDGQKFWDWLRTSRCQDYCNKSLERLRTFFESGITYGILTSNPLAPMKFTWERRVNLTCMSKEEMHQLKTREWPQALQQTVDCFLFMCHTGLHIGDFNRLTSQHVKSDYGKPYIEYSREKTGQVAIVPLGNEAQAIIAKYGSVEQMVRRTGKTTNENLKVIGLMIGTDKVLTNKIGRKTFTDICLNDKRMSEETVAKMLGHTSTKFVKVYGQVLHRRIFAEWKE